MKGRPAPGCRSISKRCSAGPAPKSTPTRCRSTDAARRGRLLGGNLETVSNIEALPTTRLYRLYFEQSLFEDRASIRLGQIAADDEFITSDTAGGLINGTFGWPALTAADIRGGGPAYPLPQPGVRLQVKPVADLTLRAAAFTGNPGGKNCPSGDPQECDPHGVLFPFSGGTLWIGEAAYNVNSGKGAAGLPGAYKLGLWHETGAFPNLAARPGRQQAQQLGRVRRRRSGVWRRPDSDEQGLNFFLRMGGAPSDRNFLSFYADAGIGFRAPFVSRPDDVVTLGGGLRPCQRRCGARRPSGRLADQREQLRGGDRTELQGRHAAGLDACSPTCNTSSIPARTSAVPTSPRRSRTRSFLGLRTTLAF